MPRAANELPEETRTFARLCASLTEEARGRWTSDHSRCALSMSPLEQQFFPNSDRTEIFVDSTLPQGASLEATERSVNTLEQWLKQQPKAQIVSSYQ